MSKFKFQLMAGGHREEFTGPDGSCQFVDYARNDVFLSERELDKQFGTAKFRRISADAVPEPELEVTQKAPITLPDAAVVPVPEIETAPVAPEPIVVPSGTTEVDERGVNVTESYEDAVTLGLTVFESKGWYSIYRDDVRLNDKALRKSEVGIALDGITDTAVESKE